MVNHVLFNKLLRTVWNTRGQFFSLVTVVSLGIMTYICMSTTFYNLGNHQSKFYRECNFADYYFSVSSAPDQVVNQIKTIPGVAQVNGRLVKDVPVIKANKERATLRIVGYQLPSALTINRLHMFSGKSFEECESTSRLLAICDAQFAASNKLSYGSDLTVVANQQEVPIMVVGTGTSPEFTYPVKDITTVLNDPNSFGVAFVPQYQAQKLLNMQGQVNSIIIRLVPGSNVSRIKEDIKEILEPYGYQGSYAQKDQNSNVFLNDQLRQLKAETRVIPAIFLIMAVAIQFVMLGRMIKTHRLQIGVMKALGFTSDEIIWHYTGYALLIGFMGTLVGIIFGFVLSGYLLNIYLGFYNLPHYGNSISVSVIFISIVLGLGVGLLAGWLSARAIVKISPAESMRSEPPVKGRKVAMESWTAFWTKISSSWKMSFRGIGRHPTRFWVTVMGVGFAVSLLVVSMFFKDSIGYIQKKAFYTDQNYDMIARFTIPTSMSETGQIAAVAGVLEAEPIIEVPVRITSDKKFSNLMLQGYNQNTRMKNISNSDGVRLYIPSQGIILSSKTAEKLDVGVGDLVKVETRLGLGSNKVSTHRVVSISQQAAGKNSYASLETVNAMLQESGVITAVIMNIDSGQSHAIETEISDMPGVSDIVSREKEVRNFNRNMDSLQVTMKVLTFFAVLLGGAIAYNSSVISLGERQRELATLRVIGMRNLEIASIIGNETILQCGLGLAVGLPLGKLLAIGVAALISSETYEFQAIVFPQTYLSSAALTAIFVFAGYVIAIRSIKNMDLIEILKNRD